MEGQHICAGSLVDMCTVVTAAHCVNKIIDPAKLVVSKYYNFSIFMLFQKFIYYNVFQFSVVRSNISDMFSL